MINLRELRLLQNYNLTLEGYMSLLEAQKGVCKICRKPPSSIDHRPNKTGTYHLHVDHCHITGEIRGLLCGKCNKALGLFQDSSALLEEAAAYLREFET